jgi:hypothetical protein
MGIYLLEILLSIIRSLKYAFRVKHLGQRVNYDVKVLFVFRFFPRFTKNDDML